MDAEGKPRLSAALSSSNKIAAERGNTFPFDEFHRLHYDADRFLQVHATSNNLQELHEALFSYHKNIVDVMHNKVDDSTDELLSMCSQMFEYENKLLELRAPMDILKSEIGQLFSVIDKGLYELKKCILSKRELGSSLMRSVQETVVLLSGAQLSKVLSLNNKELSELATLEVLERSSDHYILLQMYLECCHSNELRNEMKHTLFKFMSRLKHIFATNLLNGNGEVVTRCMQLYASIGMQAAAEDIICKKILVKRLRNIITRGKFMEVNNAGFPVVYGDLIELVDQKLRIVLDPTMSFDLQIRGFNILANCFWPTLEEFWDKLPDSVWFPVNPDKFHLYYTTEYKFITDINIKYMTPKQYYEWKSTSCYGRFLRKWNSGIFTYIQLRSVQLGKEMDQVLSKRYGDNFFAHVDLYDNRKQFYLMISEDVWNILLKCLHQNTILPLHVAKFWGILVNLLTDYAKWMDSILKEPTKFKDSRNEVQLISSEEKIDLMMIMLLVRAHHDAHLLMTKTTEALHKKFNDVMPDVGFSRVICLNILQIPFASFRAFMDRVEKYFIALLRKTNRHFREMLAVPRMYLRTHRAPPEKHSNYLSLIEHELLFFHRQIHILGEDVTEKVFEDVFSLLRQDFIDKLSEVINSVSSRIEYLKKLGNYCFDNYEDDSKIYRQLQLDADKLHDIGSSFCSAYL